VVQAQQPQSLGRHRAAHTLPGRTHSVVVAVAVRTVQPLALVVAAVEAQARQAQQPQRPGQPIPVAVAGVQIPVQVIRAVQGS